MSEEHAYAYEAGYRDGSIHYELEHCPACKNVADLQEVLEENAKLREQMERLVTLLRADCDIEASWDGLRKFWSIGLTENGCLMRDRACKAEAENAKLRELIGAGTCEADETDTWECVRDDLGGYGKTMTVHVMKCTECGHTYEHVNGDYEFCPRCGRKRKDVDA